LERIVEHVLRTDKAQMEVRTFSYPEPAADIRTHHDDSCYISFALMPRPSNARARYRDVWAMNRDEVCGDIVFVPSGMTLVASCDAGPQRYLACYLAADLFTADWTELDDRALVETLSLDSPIVQRGLRRLFEELTNPSLASPLAIDAVTTLVAIDIQRHLDGLAPEARSRPGGLSPARMRIIESRVYSGLPIPALSELAAHCGLSLRHLARAFREETGRTIGDYVSEAARDRAMYLLRASDTAIEEIARQVGFSNASSFSFAFRRDTGLKPSDVRKSLSVSTVPIGRA